MRIIKTGFQKTIECGICRSDDCWVERIEVDGVHAIYCKKCDTLNIFEDLESKTIREDFKKRVASLSK